MNKDYNNDGMEAILKPLPDIDPPKYDMWYRGGGGKQLPFLCYHKWNYLHAMSGAPNENYSSSQIQQQLPATALPNLDCDNNANVERLDKLSWKDGRELRRHMGQE